MISKAKDHQEASLVYWAAIIQLTQPITATATQISLFHYQSNSKGPEDKLKANNANWSSGKQK